MLCNKTFVLSYNISAPHFPLGLVFVPSLRASGGRSWNLAGSEGKLHVQCSTMSTYSPVRFRNLAETCFPCQLYTNAHTSACPHHYVRHHHVYTADVYTADVYTAAACSADRVFCGLFAAAF